MNKVLATLTVLAAVGTTAARADFKDFSNRCSPGAIRTCASLQVITTLNFSGGTDVTIRVRNMAGTSYLGDNSGGSIITRIGIVAPPILGPSVSGNPLSVSIVGGTPVQMVHGFNPGSFWFLRDPGGLGGLIELTAGINSGTQAGGIVSCTAPYGGYPVSYYSTCNPGEWVEFKFSTSNAWSANNADVAWLYSNTTNGNRQDECDSDPNNAGRPWCQEVVTPEPVTMVLLGSGLAGMSGFGFIRRRRQQDDKNV